MITSKEDELLESLRSVIDPEIGMNIVELGLVRNLEIDEPSDRAKITMILTTPFCPCLLYTSPSPRDRTRSRMPSSA